MTSLGFTAAEAQVTARALAGPDSFAIAPGAHYHAGGLKTLFLGGTYRRFWVTPIRVPVLDLHRFDGGLRPLKEGGGTQTKNLHLRGTDGTEFVFRLVDKHHVEVPERWRGSVIESAAKYEVSSSDPAGALVAAPLLTAGGVLHVTPVMVVMPDDSSLGKFRKDFAGRLGEIEVFPTAPHDDVPGFDGARNVINTDKLIERIDRDPSQQVDARAWLTARLMDMLLNDWDRNGDQWKWARFSTDTTALWEPIPRDRDKALISFSGLFPRIASWSTPYLMSFTGQYGSIAGLTYKSRDLDRRFLSGLEKPAWDSVALALKGRITDSAIDVAAAAMPAEYQWAAPELIRKLRERRDRLPDVATRFYAYLATAVDIHATDAADRATVDRLANGGVEVRLQSGGAPPWFDRRFQPAETKAIRMYLHDGDDTATVSGTASSSIALRIIGGNGNNLLADSSRVGGRPHSAHLYDSGAVNGIPYQADTLPERRPLVRRFGQQLQPVQDFGARMGPTMGLSINHDYGIMPRLGLSHYSYGFDKYPYASKLALEGRYSLKRSRYRVGITFDRRYEASALHLVAAAGLSQLDLLDFYGYGNNTVLAAHDTAYYAVHQGQWYVQPAVALDLSRSTTVTLGPSLRYSSTDTITSPFIAAERPYGIGATGTFGEVGLQLGLHHDNRAAQRHAREGTILDVGGTFYPAMWDVKSSFEEVHALAAYYFTIPVLTKPFMALRAGGKKLFGTFPLEDAAFIGGSTTIRTLDPERYAGDAALYATAELRIPVVKFTLLVPLDVGLLGTVDYGRVYVSGASPGGWHNAFGGGFWIGFHDLTADIRVMTANDVGGATLIAARLSLPEGIVP
ncbi:MAG: hypothetical protein ACREL5_08720 [Gemmatimonadales bacterium]